MNASLGTTLEMCRLWAMFRVFAIACLIGVGIHSAQSAAVRKGKAERALDWWSLKPLRQPPVPVVRDWGRNEVDAFVAGRLQEKNLIPSPEADARTLVRRLTYDLIGLPPTPAEIRSFVKDSETDSDEAYARLVERLLKSPHYGEQWARHWLDVARYGESHGYDKDKARFNAWPYRDYVIRSFNDDKPYSDFVQEQVAGDIIRPGEPDGIVALGFVAAGPWDYIAHSEVGEGKLDGRIAKHMDRDDMVSAVFNTFMSTTVQCAQCHDHKFDPVSMQDYYRLHTIFAAVDRADRVYDLDPVTERQRRKLEKAVVDLDTKRKAIAKKIDDAGGAELAELRARVKELEKTGHAKLKTVPEHGYHSQIVKGRAATKWVQVELPAPTEIVRLDLIGCHDNYNGIGAGFGFPVRFRVELSDDATFKAGVVLVGDYTKGDLPNPGVTPVSIAVNGAKAKFIRVTATRLAERKKDYILALAELQAFDPSGKNVARAGKVTAKDSIEASIRWGKSNLIDGKYSTGVDLPAMTRLKLAKADLHKLLVRLDTKDIRVRRTALEKELAAKRKALSGLPKGQMVYAIASSFKRSGKVIPTGGKPREIRHLLRGDLRTPGDVMKPGAPALWNRIQPEFPLAAPDDEGQRRRALAAYLTARDNPLTWRSIVNRIWLYHMGRGIVDSPNDFGQMGQKPTHPKLLDWLAHRFRDQQSIKDLHRLIVMSSTYRQVSTHDSGKAAIDGSNQFYWRMPRRKLRAEELRDAVLSVAGKLDPKLGGKSYQDFKFKDDHTPKFWYHLYDENNPASHRRSVYRFIARSQTHPFMTALDCADPSQMVAKRDETTTALQALALLNNPFMTAMSEHLAKRVKPAKSPIGTAIWLTAGRAPTKLELRSLNSYSAKHGLANACRLIFNLNEFAYLD
jgi:hypothetical protein